MESKTHIYNKKAINQLYLPLLSTASRFHDTIPLESRRMNCLILPLYVTGEQSQGKISAKVLWLYNY